jgi:hypothetical protein
VTTLVTGGTVRYGTSDEKAYEKIRVSFTDAAGVDPLGGLSNEQRSRIVKAALDAIIANLPYDGAFPGYYAFAAGEEITETKTQVSTHV